MCMNMIQWKKCHYDNSKGAHDNFMASELILLMCSMFALAITWMMSEYILFEKKLNIWAGIMALAGIVLAFAAAYVLKWDTYLLGLAGGSIGLLIYYFFDRNRREALILMLSLSAMVSANIPVMIGIKEAYHMYLLWFLMIIFGIAMAPYTKKDKKTETVWVKRDEFTPFYLLFLIFPILAIAVAVSTDLKERSSWFAICWTAGLILIYLACIWLIQQLVIMQNMAQLLQEAEQRQKESGAYMNVIRSQRHDFNIHLYTISGLIRSGEYEKCDRYVSDLVSEANAINDIMPVRDAVIGSMLYNMREEARRKGSDIEYHITYDMYNIAMSGFECNKVIGNLLQNAIDALKTKEDKAARIRMKILKRRGNTVIIVENRFVGDYSEIAEAFMPGYSTKKHHDGIGLYMVKKAVERQGGRIYTELEGETLRFTVNIPNLFQPEDKEID